jgi:hypothetical protein
MFRGFPHSLQAHSAIRHYRFLTGNFKFTVLLSFYNRRLHCLNSEQQRRHRNGLLTLKLPLLSLFGLFQGSILEASVAYLSTIYRLFLVYCTEHVRNHACGTRGIHTGFWWGMHRERDHYEEQDVDGRIILTFILENLICFILVRHTNNIIKR